MDLELIYQFLNQFNTVHPIHKIVNKIFTMESKSYLKIDEILSWLSALSIGHKSESLKRKISTGKNENAVTSNVNMSDMYDIRTDSMLGDK